MKNTVIAFMALLCGYLLLHTLGAFEYGSFIDREHRGHYMTLRADTVNASPVYVLGAVYDDSDWADVEAIQGITLAVDIVNSEKKGKPYKLVTHSTAYSKPQHNEAIQTFAGASDTAFVIGPFESIHIPASRALTQFHGLPLISPITVASDKLPHLEPDNFVTLFPPLPLWVDAILDHMERSGIKNIFILSPGKGVYGDIFCTEMERSSRSHHNFDQVFRLNYQEPLRRQDIDRLLRSHIGKNRFDAIFFGGNYQDMTEFSAILQDNQISLPVYGSDSLYAPEVSESFGPYPLYLPRAISRNDESDFMVQWHKKYGTNPGYLARFGAETVFMLDDVLQEIGTYDAQKITEEMRKAVQKRLDNPEIAPEIAIDAFPPKKQ